MPSVLALKVMPCNDSILICQTLNLLSASLKPYVDENAIPGEDTYRRILCWCIMWGFGGLLEPENRKVCRGHGEKR